MECPVIGIIGNTYMTQSGMLDSMERVHQNSYYVDAIMGNGGIPVILPIFVVMEQTKEITRICDGILFLGGEDMTPSHYGEDLHPAIQVYKPEVDEALMRMGYYALEHKKPMPGIHKGNQLLNAPMGGSPHQDLSFKGSDCIRRLQLRRWDYLTHQIQVGEGTRLLKPLGSGACMTNSMHHQSVKELGKGLRTSAYADDGIVEAIEDQEGTIAGVQWHPENLLESALAMNHPLSDLCGRALERKAGSL